MKSFTAVSALVATTFAATIDVTIGPGLQYSPDSITANQGDVVNFKFGSGHNVVSGSFDSPCQPDGKIFSGNNANSGDVFAVTINSTDPTWIYCSVPGHCEAGMAMVINAPSSGNTLDSYKNSAKSASSSNSPSDITGGVFANANSGSSASSSASSAMSSATSAASSKASSATSAAASATKSSSADSVKVGVAGAVGVMGMWALL